MRALLILLLAVTLHAQDDPAPRVKPAYESDPKFLSAMKDAREARADDKLSFAADGFKKAVKLSGGQCRRCLNDLYAVQAENHSWKDAVSTAQQLQAIAETPKQRSTAEADLGDALYHQAGEKPKPDQLQAAHTAFAAAITDYPSNAKAKFTDACILARLGRTDEAGKQFTDCTSDENLSKVYRNRARHFAENPTLAANRMAPPFQLTALDGTKFNLDDQTGRVVLIDFWATWCPACVESLPELKHLAQKFADAPLTILSVSQDEDEAAWKAYIAKNNMTWLQFRDKSGRISRLFDFQTIPRYFVIDSDGILSAESMGSDSDVEGKLAKLIKKARESKPTPTTTTTASTK